MWPTQTKFTSLVVRLTLVFMLLATLIGSVSAAAGDLDTTFGSPKGFVTTDISTADDQANAVAIQADGKIIAAGYSKYGGITAKDFTLVRYSATGVPDAGFGLGGKVVTSVAAGNLDDVINAIALQTDGNIIVAGPINVSGGKSVFGVARYLSTTGALDPSFGVGGIVTTGLSLNNDIPTAIGIQADRKIVVGGSANANFAVARYNANGTLDTATFGAGLGFVTTDFGSTDLANALVIQPADSKIILGGDTTFGVTGRNFALARYTSAGLLDTTFNSTGKVVTNFLLHSNDFIESLALQATGEIVAAGYSDSGGVDEFALARYTAGGLLDGTFGGTAFFTTPIGSIGDQARAVAVLPAGKIVVAGFSNQGATRLNDFTVARYTSAGVLDTSFGTGGIVTSTLTATSDDLVEAMSIQPDRNIVVAGSSNAGAGFDFAVARYLEPNVPPVVSGFIKDGLEDHAVAFSASDFTSHAMDADGDPVARIKVTSLPAHGTLKVNTVAVTVNQEIQAADLGTLTFTPELNQNGTASFGWNASDGLAYAVSGATVSIAIAPVNDPPSFTAGANQTVLKDSGPQTVSGWATNLLAGPPDEIAQTLTFSVTNDNNPLFSAQPAIDSGGSLTFTPALTATGTTTVTLILKDSGGTANGGVDTSLPQTFKLTILGYQLYLPLILR